MFNVALCRNTRNSSDYQAIKASIICIHGSVQQISLRCFLKSLYGIWSWFFFSTLTISSSWLKCELFFFLFYWYNIYIYINLSWHFFTRILFSLLCINENKLFFICLHCKEIELKAVRLSKGSFHHWYVMTLDLNCK